MNAYTLRRVLVSVFVVCMSVVTMVLAVANEVGGAALQNDLILAKAFATLTISQVCLAAVWLAIGQTRFTIRILVAIVIVCVRRTAD